MYVYLLINIHFWSSMCILFKVHTLSLLFYLFVKCMWNFLTCGPVKMQVLYVCVHVYMGICTHIYIVMCVYMAIDYLKQQYIMLLRQQYIMLLWLCVILIHINKITLSAKRALNSGDNWKICYNKQKMQSLRQLLKYN